MSVIIKLRDKELTEVNGGVNFRTISNGKIHTANDHAIKGLLTAQAAGGAISLGKKKKV